MLDLQRAGHVTVHVLVHLARIDPLDATSVDHFFGFVHIDPRKRLALVLHSHRRILRIGGHDK